MSRIDLNVVHGVLFSVKTDASGARLCPWCGRPIPSKQRLQSFCCHACRDWAATAVSWTAARMWVAKRDGYKCRRCGSPVYVFWQPDGYADTITDPAYAEYRRCCRTGRGDERQAEIHHVVRVGSLYDTAYNVAMEAETEDLRKYWVTKLYAMLYLDVNNLVTLCQKPCHDVVHARDYRNPVGDVPVRWLDFLRGIHRGELGMWRLP